MAESFFEMVRTVLEIYGEAFPVGMLIAASGALFGVFVVLKRVVFIGITLSEAAACGVALGLLLGWNPFLGALLMTMSVVLFLGLPFERWLQLPRDALLGVLFVAFSAGSIVLVAKSGFGLERVKSLLFGSLLFASRGDLLLILAVLLPSTAFLLIGIRPTVYAFLDPDAATVLGIPVKAVEFSFFTLLGLTVAAASKVAGVLLIFCYLVIAPSTALLLCHRMPGTLLTSVVIGWTATVGGILVSYRFDLPPNQTIGLLHCWIFLPAALAFSARRYIGSLAGIPCTAVVTIAGLAWLLSAPQAPAPSDAMKQAFETLEQPSEAREHAGRPAGQITDQVGVSSGVADPGITSAALSSEGVVSVANDWESLTAGVLARLEVVGKPALPEAVALLDRAPPLLFRSRLVEGIDRVLGEPSGWNIRAGASDGANLAARRRCLESATTGPMPAPGGETR